MVLSLVGTDDGPSERERSMAERKLAEAEEGQREADVGVSHLCRTKPPRAAEWYAAALDEASADLFAESATLYAEHGVALQDGIRELSRHLRAMRLLACGALIRPLEKLLTRAGVSQRDEEERAWVTLVRSLLTELRGATTEVADALREFDEMGSTGWKPAQESEALTTEWRADDDGSLWIRMDGELTGAELSHAVGVAYEADLWPRWVPLCSAAEVVRTLSPMERVIYLQFDLGPVMRRGALLHWTCSDSLSERQSLLLLGASLGEGSGVERPAAAEGVTLADFRAIKLLVTPRTRTSARIQWVTNVDLKAKSMPSSMVSMVTKKIAGSIITALVREAQKVSRDAARDADAAQTAAADGSAAAAASENVYLKRMAEHAPFYSRVGGLFDNFFDLFGEEEEGEEEDDD